MVALLNKNCENCDGFKFVTDLLNHAVPAVAPWRKSKLAGNSKTASFLLTLHDDGG